MATSHPVPIPTSMKSFADPSKVGKGAWYLLYLMISEIKTIEDREAVKFAIQCLRKRFHCLKCRNHFDKFCNEHPFIKILYADDPKEIFAWVYQANTQANLNAGHGIQPFEDFNTFFYEDVICDHDCGGPKTPPQNGSAPPYIPDSTPLTVIPPIVHPQSRLSVVPDRLHQIPVSTNKPSIWTPIHELPKVHPTSPNRSSNIPFVSIRPVNKELPPPPNFSIIRPTSPNRYGNYPTFPNGLPTVPGVKANLTPTTTRFITSTRK
jgi:hypothetical protein